MPRPDLRASRTYAPTRALVAAFAVAVVTTAVGQTAIESAGKDMLQLFLEQHCFKCHSGDDAKHDLRLDELAFDLERKELRKQWDDVLEQIESGEMPPKKKPRPSPEELHAVTAMLNAKLGEAEERRRAAEGRVVLRRLNRAEYENTIHDLLAVDTPLRDLLPEDSTAHGFDNAAEALQTSSFLLERYLEAADTALRDAIVNRPKPTVVKLHNTIVQSHRFKSDTERVYRRLEGDTVALFSSSHWNSVELSQLWPQERGRYRYRISVYAVQSQGKPVTFSVMNGDGGMGGAKSHLVGYFDAPPDKPEVFEFVDLVEPRTGGSILPYGTATAHVVSKIGAETYDGPGVAIEWTEVEGPLNETWPPPSHRAIFGDLPQVKSTLPNQSDRLEVASEEPLKDAERILRSFARRAFRHPVSDAELEPYLALVKMKLADQRSFEQSVRVGLAAILTSPDFLFFRETPGQLDDFALASRLSYFLWSSLPDDELLGLAERGELHEPAVLRKQVDRLLNHEKAKAFAQNFAGQWLGLRDIDATEPSQFLYPEFDNMLKVSMVKEAELFFQEVLKNDLSIENFLASDFSMLNGRLARHYGIAGVDGWTFRKTSLPPESHRGGLLTMAAVLKVTANGTSTSPVKRGVWVLERILGTPPKPPPRDAGSIEPDTRGTSTIREQLAKHRRLESCASCHVSIDPPGFALESFDVIGGWRERYRSTGNGAPAMKDGVKMAYLDGPKVDPSDVLPDGRTFADIDEFKRLLLEQKEPFARALAAKLVTYATGEAPNRFDKERIAAIVAECREKNYGFRSLVHAVVQSELFRQK